MLLVILIKFGILPLALFMDVVAPCVGEVQQHHWGSNFEDGSCESSPHIGNSLGEIVGKGPLFKWGDAVGDHMPDPRQISKVAAHGVLRSDLGLRTQKYMHHPAYKLHYTYLHLDFYYSSSVITSTVTS